MGFSDPKKNIAQLGISEGMSVADFGAGAGHYAVAAADAVGEEGLVYVVDIQRELLTKVKHLATNQQAARIQYICGDLEQPHGSTLADESCDVVLLSNILFQVDDKNAVVDEAQRVLKPGGRVLIVDWTASHGNVGPPEDHVFGKEAALALIGEKAVSLRSEIDAGAYHYGLVFQKNA